MRQKTHSAAADYNGAAKKRKSSHFLHHTCLLQLNADLQQILRPSECALTANF